MYYRPTELFSFLESIGVNPKKSLSQNFLIDGNVIRKIVAEAAVSPGEAVLEIGPGPGALTEALLTAGANVTAVEKDTCLAQALHRLDPSGASLKVICEDIMDYPLPSSFSGKLIANLPYHLTTPILARYVPLHAFFSSITVMVQEEVARRFTAKVGTPEYGSFTIFLQFYSVPRYGFKVSRNSFYPIPGVDSAIVSLELRPPPLEEKEAAGFFALTRAAFGQRRKMLRSSLREHYPQEALEKAFKEADISPESRPERLSLDDFLRLHKSLVNKTKEP